MRNMIVINSPSSDAHGPHVAQNPIWQPPQHQLPAADLNHDTPLHQITPRIRSVRARRNDMPPREGTSQTAEPNPHLFNSVFEAPHYFHGVAVRSLAAADCVASCGP